MEILISSNQNDKHYNTQKLLVKEKRAILRFAKIFSYKWWIDELDPSLNWTKRRTNRSFEEILEKLKKDSQFTMIYRIEYLFSERHGEIGFTTSGPGDSFCLWILVKKDIFERILQKFKLGISNALIVDELDTEKMLEDKIDERFFDRIIENRA